MTCAPDFSAGAGRIVEAHHDDEGCDEMMYGSGYGLGWVWMTVLPLVLITLIALIIWAVVRLTQRQGDGDFGPKRPEAAREILDRRFAMGEIDTDTYAQARTRLSGSRTREPGSS